MDKNMNVLNELKNEKEVLDYLESIGVETKYIKGFGESNMREYIKNYGHFKVGDEVKLKDNEFTDIKKEIAKQYTNYDEEFGMYILDDLKQDEMYEEIKEYEDFLVGKTFKIESFYNLGACHLEGFDYGMCLYRFEHA